jgi:hypothetical protein
MESCRRRCSEIRATGPLLHRKWVVGRGLGSKLAPTTFREAGAARGDRPPVERRSANAVPAPVERGRPTACRGAVQDKKESCSRRHFGTASRGGENRAPARASTGQGSSRQGDCKSQRGGSDGRSVCAAPTRFGWTSGFKSVRTQVRSRAAQLQQAQSDYQRASFCLTPSQIAEVRRLHRTGNRRRRPTAALGRVFGCAIHPPV